MNNPEQEKRQPCRGRKQICVPFASEAQDQRCIDDVAQYRTYLTQVRTQHPELFPPALAQGYTLHDLYPSRKQGVGWRRIKLKATAEVCTLRPSFLLPSGIARTEAGENALYWRPLSACNAQAGWGVPCDALAYVFGRAALCW
jgi:hypothetical protein